LLSHQKFENMWIIDLEASNHITNYSSLFSTYEKCNDNAQVVAYGSLTSIARKRDIKLPGLTLSSVLYIPNINCNLISVSKLTRHMQCAVKFSSSCVFHDLISRKMIGNAKGKNGLYFLSNPIPLVKDPLI